MSKDELDVPRVEARSIKTIVAVVHEKTGADGGTWMDSLVTRRL
jgi:hypothetical protein